MMKSFLDKRISTILKLSTEAFGQYKKPIVVLIFLGFISGILEGIGVNALIPLFSFSFGEAGNASDPISKIIEKTFDFFNINFSVPYLLILIVILFIGKAVVLIFLNYLRLKITHDYEEITRQSLLARIVSSRWEYLITQKSGHLETILLVDSPAAAGLLNQISSVIMIVTGLIIYTLVAINISFVVTVITLILGLIFFLLIKPVIYRVKIISEKRAKINKEIAHHVSEHITGMKTVKSMVVTDSVNSLGASLFNRFGELSVRIGVLKSMTTSFVQPFGVIFISLLFVTNYKSAGFNLAAMIALVYLIHRIFTQIQQLERSLHSMVEFIPHLQSVIDYQREAQKAEEKNNGQQKFVFEHDIKINNLNFSYNHGSDILSGVNLSIKKGEMIGIIGPSGTGKTTFVDLLLRLFEPKNGTITVDGQNITNIDLYSWRKNIGYVSQDSFILNDTIANNIRFYDDSITQEEIIESAKKANIYDFIQGSAQGFDTVVGERGVMLSGGQRQRLVIARVLARKPQLLILDEATSALDNESEIKIQEVIHNLKGEVTIISIAHRLSTILDSDRLVVLEKGVIIEEGSPANLLKDKDSYFFKVYNIRKNNS